jgi:hypothetical protein
MRLNLQNIEAGTPIGITDVILPEEMRLTSIEGRVATITRAPGATGIPFSAGFAITIDLDRQRFEVTSSGELGESIGVGPCLAL